MPTNRVRRARAKPRPKVEEHISRQLRAIYDDVVAQPIPDRFVELLRELEAGSKGSGGGGDA